jgi:hypothetical protein
MRSYCLSLTHFNHKNRPQNLPMELMWMDALPFQSVIGGMDWEISFDTDIATAVP